MREETDRDYLLTSTVPLDGSGFDKFPEGKLWGRIVRLPEQSYAINAARAIGAAYGARIEVRVQPTGELVWPVESGSAEVPNA